MVVRDFVEPQMRVGIEYRIQGFPHSNEPEKSMKVELWVGVIQRGGARRY